MKVKQYRGYTAVVKTSTGVDVFSIHKESDFEVHFDVSLLEVRFYTEDVVYIMTIFVSKNEDSQDCFSYCGEGDTFTITKTEGLPVSTNRRTPMRFTELPIRIQAYLAAHFGVLAMKERD